MNNICYSNPICQSQVLLVAILGLSIAAYSMACFGSCTPALNGVIFLSAMVLGKQSTTATDAGAKRDAWQPCWWPCVTRLMPKASLTGNNGGLIAPPSVPAVLLLERGEKGAKRRAT